MAVASKFAKLLEKNHFELRDLQKKSLSWFNAQANSLRDVKNLRAESLMNGDQNNKSSRIIPGTMIMYMYDPKGKETLPYYDNLPMCLPFKLTKDGFIGLNLHYLPYNLRVRLLERLMEFRTNKNMDATTRMRFSWQLLDGASKFAIAKPCVKQYLYAHVKSQFKIIEPNDWATALLLPVERFQKQTTQQVWTDSRRIIRNG